METTVQDTQNQAEINAKTIAEETEKLKTGYWETPNVRNYREFWEHFHYVINLFKLLKPLLNEDRDKLWKDLSDLREETKLKEQTEWEGRRSDSMQKRLSIESEIKEMQEFIVSIQDFEGAEKAKELLKKTLERIRVDAQNVTETGEELNSDTAYLKRMFKEDRDACWQLWRQADELFKKKKAELDDVNFNNVKGEVLEILRFSEVENPHEALRKIKEIQSEQKIYKFSKNLREELRLILNQAFEKALLRVKEMNEERKKNHQEWKTRMEGNMVRWVELKSKNEGIIASLETQVAKLEEDSINPKTPEFGEKISQWIDEKNKKIEEIKETNQKLDEKINSVRKRIEKKI